MLPTRLVTGYGARAGRFTTPPYSPNLKPSNFILLGLYKKHLAGKRFATDVGLKKAVIF